MKSSQKLEMTSEKWRWVIVVFVIVVALFHSHPVLAQTVPNVTTTKLPDASGGLFQPGDSSSGHGTIHFPNLISSFTSGDFLQDIFGFTVDILALVSGLLAFGYIIYGGIKFVTAGGAPAGAEEGKKIVISAIIGIFIISLAYVVVTYIRSLLTGG